MVSSQSGVSLPIGTILPYVGDLANIPSGWHLCDGSNGTPNLSSRFLEGVTSGAKQWRDAGLPNITATFSGGDLGSSQTSGAVYWTGRTGDRLDGGDWGRQVLGFNASRSSAVYGRSSTVQPASYTVYYIMRIK